MIYTAHNPATDYTVVGSGHALRVNGGEFELLERTPEGFRTIGNYDSPAVAMDVLDLLEGH